MMPLHPPGRNIAQTLSEDREAIIMADRLGFSEAYVGEGFNQCDRYVFHNAQGWAKQ